MVFAFWEVLVVIFILGALGAAASGIALGGQVVSGVKDMFSTPSRRGRDARKYLDSAYPGTSAYERLGAGGAGVAGAEAQRTGSRRAQTVNREQQTLQANMQQKELATRLRQSQIQAISPVVERLLDESPGNLPIALDILHSTAEGVRPVAPGGVLLGRSARDERRVRADEGRTGGQLERWTAQTRTDRGRVGIEAGRARAEIGRADAQARHMDRQEFIQKTELRLRALQDAYQREQGRETRGFVTTEARALVDAVRRAVDPAHRNRVYTSEDVERAAERAFRQLNSGGSR